MTDTRTFTVPAYLEGDVARLVQRLRALTDSQLDEVGEYVRERLRGKTSRIVPGEGVVWEDPVASIESSIDSLRVSETNHRLDVVQAMEADLVGGHLVSVGVGNDMTKYRATCDPNPPEPFCWEGPDRDTIEEAKADGRAHHPGHEPRLCARFTDE